MSVMVNPYRFAAAGGGGGISFVGSKTFTHELATPQSCALTDLLDEAGAAATLLEDDLIVIALNQAHNTDRTQAQLTCKDPGAADYTLPHSDLYANDVYDTNLQVQYKFMGATPDATVTIPANSTTSFGTAAVIFAFRGVDTTTPMDTTATTATGTNTGAADPPSIMPVTAGAWILACGAKASSGTVHAFTNPGDLSAGTNHFRSVGVNATTADPVVAIGFKSDWTSGAFDPTVFTTGGTSTDNSWCAATLALRPA